VPANGTATATVTLQVDGDAPNLNVRGDTLFGTTNKTLLYEVSGYVEFARPGDPATTRVAVYAAPHLTAALATPATLIVDASGNAALPVTGAGFDHGVDANDYRSLASVYRLIATDAVESGLYWDVDGDGISEPEEQLSDFSYADVHRVGASLHQANGSTNLHLGLAMHGEWTTPRDLYTEVSVDVEDDGVFDYLYFTGTEIADGITVSVVVLSSNQGFVWDFVNYGAGASLDTMLLRNNVMSLPLTVADAFLSSVGGPAYAGGPIRVRVDTYQRDTDFSVPIDSVEATWTPGVDFGQADNLRLALDGETIPFTLDFAALPTLPSLLTLQHHNQDPASRAAVTALLPAALPFALLTPADGSSVASAVALGPLSWEALAQATGYTVTVGALVYNGTPAADGDAVTCDATTCVLQVEPLPLPAGTYSWTVQAAHPGGAQAAANAPFGFTLQADVPVRVFRNGFEG
jgi:hypothetical protein